MNGWLYWIGAIGSSMIIYGAISMLRDSMKVSPIPHSPEAPECITLEELAPIWREKEVPKPPKLVLIKEAKKESSPESEEPEEPSEPFF
jgi:hypothetical protein